MIEKLTNLSWPGAIVVCVGMICVACVMIALYVAVSGSRFPWEK